MEKQNNRLEDNLSAFRPYSRRFSSSHSKIVPPIRFVASHAACGLKELYTKLHNTKPAQHNKEAQKHGLVFHSEAATKLAGRYKVVQLIGQGQSSIIVAAEDLYHPSKKTIAIKIMNLDYFALGTQEADCIYQLNRADPLNVSKIVRLLNKFIFQDHFCMVFELLRPRPLHLYFQESYFNSEAEKLDKIREVAEQVLGVLGFLRRENVIHADLKPENILLESAGRIKVKVVDFGNAIRWIHREMSLYYDNFELQTLLYRAPEVIFGVPFGPEVDMWSLGCILAELYLGKPLFVGKDKSEVLQEIVSTLGPLPRIPFQSGKFYSDFVGFLNFKTGSKAASTEIQLMRRLNNMKNFTFANFLSGLLQYNPNKRFTPLQAISHPFLAAHITFGGFLTNSVAEPQGSYGPSCSGILLTSSDYLHRPHIDDDIRRQNLSGNDLLYVGTRGKTSVPERSSTPPVGRVVPLVVCDKNKPANTKSEGVSSLPSSPTTSLPGNSFRPETREQRHDVQSVAATKPAECKETTHNDIRTYKRLKSLSENDHNGVNNRAISPTSRVKLAAESAVVHRDPGTRNHVQSFAATKPAECKETTHNDIRIYKRLKSLSENEPTSRVQLAAESAVVHRDTGPRNRVQSAAESAVIHRDTGTRNRVQSAAESAVIHRDTGTRNRVQSAAESAVIHRDTGTRNRVQSAAESAVIHRDTDVQSAAERAVIHRDTGTNRTIRLDSSQVNKKLITKDQNLKTSAVVKKTEQVLTSSEHERKTSKISDTRKRKHPSTEAVEHFGTRLDPEEGVAGDLLCTSARTRAHFHPKKIKHNQNQFDFLQEFDSIPMSGNNELNCKPPTPSVKLSQLTSRGVSSGSLALFPVISPSSEKRTVSLRQDTLSKKKTVWSVLPNDVKLQEVKPQRKARRSLKLSEEVDCDVILL